MIKYLAILWLTVSFAGPVSGQTPDVVLQALQAKTPFQCWEGMVVSDTMIGWFPEVAFYVGRCTTYYGTNVTSVVGVEPDGQLHLFRSREALKFFEVRQGRPALDTTNVVGYALLAAKMAGQVPWDAELYKKGMPKMLSAAAVLTLEGACSQAAAPFVLGRDRGGFEVTIASRNDSWLGRTRAYFGSPESMETEPICWTVHNP